MDQDSNPGLQDSNPGSGDYSPLKLTTQDVPEGYSENLIFNNSGKIRHTNLKLER